MNDIFLGFRDEIKTLLWPKQYFAWQTLLLLSLFSLIVAAMLESVNGGTIFAVDVLTTLSWLFFTAAIWWALSESKPIKLGKVSLSPWITGIVLCLFLFRPWTDVRFRWAFSSWPMISTAIAALPEFMNWELKFSVPKPAVQKTLVMTLLINLLLSSWIMFFFRIQDWVGNYPSLLVKNLDNSAFVYDFGRDRETSSQGVPLLESMTTAIAADLDGQPWYQAERWLYTRKERLERISQTAFDELDAPGEQAFWRINIREPRAFGEGYLLDMRATWAGPINQQRGLYLEKTCKIVPIDRPRAVRVEKDQPQPTSKITSVDCGEKAVEQWETPET